MGAHKVLVNRHKPPQNNVMKQQKDIFYELMMKLVTEYICPTKETLHPLILTSRKAENMHHNIKKLTETKLDSGTCIDHSKVLC